MTLPPIFLALPILAVGGVFSAVAGGGLSIIATIVFDVLGFSIHQSVALAALLMTAMQLAKLFHFRGSARWSIALWYCVLGVPASYAGGLLLFWVPGRTLELIIGTIIGLLGTHELLPFRGVTLRTKPTPGVLLPLGALNGVVGGIVGNAALVRAPALLSMGLRKEEFIGTSTVIALPMNLAKAVPYAYGVQWSTDIVWLFVSLVPTLFISVWIGKRLLAHCSHRLFEILQGGILLAGAIKLLAFP